MTDIYVYISPREIPKGPVDNVLSCKPNKIVRRRQEKAIQVVCLLICSEKQGRKKKEHG